MSTKTEFVPGQYYHVYTRGVDRRRVFMNESDFKRFYSSLFLFNDSKYISAGGRSDDKLLRLCFAETTQYDTRDRLADIVTFNLLQNHLHIVAVPLVKDGISKLMHKCLMGYSRYFNIKNDRVGALFETYKAKLISNQAYLEHMIPYVHLNVTDGFETPWREGVADNWELIMKHLDNHSWSGHHVAMCREQMLPVICEKYMNEMYTTTEEYLAHLRGWSRRELPN
jgi:REP element-mobilizing transposase RayT